MSGDSKPWKRALKRVLPASVLAWHRRRRSLRFTGPYASWREAAAQSTGYDAADILPRVIAATRAVVAGRAAFERDSILFREPASEPVIVAALRAAAPADVSALRVLDFGGSLGSTYRQIRNEVGAPMRWHVVEQPAFVEAGQREFSTSELRFHHTIEDVVAVEPPHAVVLGSVLPYVEDPWSILAKVAALPARTWIVTRTAFADTPEDRVLVQHVPPSIYRASYPAWVLATARFSAFWAALGCRMTWHPAEEGAVRVGALAFEFKTAVITRL